MKVGEKPEGNRKKEGGKGGKGIHPSDPGKEYKKILYFGGHEVHSCSPEANWPKTKIGGWGGGEEKNDRM